MKIYAHYRDYPKSLWRWHNFTPQEMASKREGELAIDDDAMDRLQRLRELAGRPLIVNSAYRSKAHNKAVGGASNSQHMLARAFDISMTNHDPDTFIRQARSVGFTGIGTYPHLNMVHVDTGPERSWGNPFPRSATGLPQEPVEDRGATKAAAGAGASGVVAVALEHLPIAGGVLGQLAPVAQTIAVVSAVVFLVYLVWRRRH